MRRMSILLAITALFGCATQGEFFPPGSFSTDPEWDARSRRLYGADLSALHEPALAEKPRAHVIRALVLPSFSHPCSLRVKIRRSGRGALIYRRGSGWGGYDPGYLDRARRIPLRRAQVSRLLFLLEYGDFWATGATLGYPSGHDGTLVVLESVRDGHYHVVNDVYSYALADIAELLFRYAEPIRTRRRRR